MRPEEFAKKMDVTLVRNSNTEREVLEIITAAKKYRFASVFAMQCYLKLLSSSLEEIQDVNVGGVIGFPSGAELTEIKLFEAKTCIEYGADELDMVINLGWLKSGMFESVENEIREIKEVCGNRPLKCIIEISCLEKDEAKKASEIIVKAGADYVKTGTGWFEPVTVEDVKLIKEVIGDAAFIKAAGGIRTYEQALALINAGASRLGVGLKSAVGIIESATKTK